MKLSAILKNIEPLEVIGSQDVDVNSICFDSRKISSGSLFVAERGTVCDGHTFIPSAEEKGAAAIICEQIPENPKKGVTYVKVKDSSYALGVVSSNFYGNPSEQLTLVGVTGTNGKTSIATLLYDMFTMLGYKVGLISTVSYRIGDKTIDSTHTTPDSVRLNAMMAEMVDAGCSYCFMEVSSHSVVQKRIAGLSFKGGIFTNLTHDHLDYHGTFSNYIAAKQGFFDTLSKDAFALTNADDRNGMIVVQNTSAQVKTYSLRNFSDYKTSVLEEISGGMLLKIDEHEVWVEFLGRFNAYNLLAVYATACLLGADKHEVLTALSRLNPPKGRFEYVNSDSGIIGIVDYAHTPDALINVINTINDIRQEGQRLFVVVGCGGNRDKTKRPIMAKIAAESSELAILTSDNPRNEDPDDILNDMKQGIDSNHNFLSITSRADAIKTAVMLAAKGDYILIAGKGHETYQEISGVRHHFDDKEELENALKTKK